MKGEILELKSTINTMVDQLNAFAPRCRAWRRKSAPTASSAARRRCRASAGVWKDLTDNVNQLAANLTGQVRNIAEVTTAVAQGRPVEEDHGGREGRGARAEEHHQHDGRPAQRFAGEVSRVAREVGTEGKLGGQAQVKGVGGVWKDLTDNVNSMAANLTGQVRNIAEVTTAVAKGDLSKKITAEAKGEILELKNTINTLVDQLNASRAR